MPSVHAYAPTFVSRDPAVQSSGLFSKLMSEQLSTLDALLSELPLSLLCLVNSVIILCVAGGLVRVRLPSSINLSPLEAAAVCSKTLVIIFFISYFSCGSVPWS